MKTIRIRYVSLIIALLITGCAAPRMNTASGHPEVTINAPKPAAKAALLDRLVNSGFTVVQDSDSTVLGDGDTNGWMDFWFTNTFTGERPKNRLRSNLIESNGATRIVGTICMVHAPGFSGRVSEVENTNPKAYERLQTFLNAVQVASENPARK